jgi:transcriptional antiterminator RfaH
MALGYSESNDANPAQWEIKAAWFCARTKPKHEHIAAANLQRHAGLEVFCPRLRVEKPTRRGIVRLSEPLFPNYIFVRCVLDEAMDSIRYTNGISSLVQFGGRTVPVGDDVIAELQGHFADAEPVPVAEKLRPGSEVVVARGAFEGMRASVLRVLPARRRVEVLLDILGRPTAVEVDRHAVSLESESVADLVPFLAAA